MSEPVEAMFTFTRDEYVRAIRRHYKTRLRTGRDVIGGTAGIFGGLYLALTSRPAWIGWLLFTASAALLVMVGYALFVVPRLIYNSQPKLKSRYQLTFADKGIRFKTDNVDSTLQWSLYESWLSDEEFYVLYHGKKELSVIPRRVLTANDADGRLRELLERNIGPALK